MSSRLALLQKFLQIDTSNGGELLLAEAMANQLALAGIEVRVDPVQGGRANLVARLPGKSAVSSLLFNAHMDTVPAGDGWSKLPLGGDLVDGNVYGRGASDTKSSLAAMAVAMMEIATAGVILERDLFLLGTAGEETDFGGAKAFVAAGGMEQVGCLIVGEPTNQAGRPLCMDVVNTTKGSVSAEVIAKGVSAHGASPEQGVNAVLRLAEFLDWLRRHPPYEGYTRDLQLGAPTWAPTMVQGGKATNMIPDACSVILDLRPIPGMTEEDSLRPFRAAAESIWGPLWPDVISITKRHFLPSLQCDRNQPTIQLALQAAATVGITAGVRGFLGACDASFLQPDPPIPFFIFGPGIDSQAHRPDEYVQAQDYLASIEFYKVFALGRLQAKN